MTLLLLAASSALGSAVGVGVDLATDLPEGHDPAAPELRTGFPLGVGLRVPVLVPLGGGVALRLSPRLEGASGQAVLRLEPAEGASVSDAARSWYASGGLLVGPEVRFGRGAVTPAVSGGAGGVVAATFHDLDRCGWLADPGSVEGCGGSEPTPAIGPSTLQLAAAVEASVGLRFLPSSPGAGAWVDLGFGSVGLGAADLGPRAAEGAARAPFAYNAARLSVGAWFGAAR